MSKKHFIVIAARIKANIDAINASEGGWSEIADPASARRTVKYMALELADVFAEENPRFDRSRFLAACGFVN